MTECGPLAPPGSIVGCATVTQIYSDGTRETLTRDMRAFTVAAYVPDSTMQSGFRIINGTSAQNGVVRVDGVPDGAYYLRLQDPTDAISPWPHYYYTQARDLRLHTVQLGRDDTPVTRATPVTIDLSGLTACHEHDWITVDSINSGTNVPFDINAVAFAGATAFSLTSDWQSGNGESTFSDFLDTSRRSQLLTASRGDDLWVRHSRTTPLDNGMREHFADTIVDFFTTNTITITDGSAITIPAVHQPAPASPTPQQLSVNLAAARMAMRDNGRYRFEEYGCERVANAGASEGLLRGGLVAIKGSPWPSETSVNVSTPYTDPYPTSWPQMMNCTLTHVHRTIINGMPKGDASYGYTFAAASNNFIWTLPVHGPTTIEIGGRDALAGGTVQFDGTPVRMTWDAQPGINHYAVRVLGAVESVVGKFDTYENSITFPPDIFADGNFYVFRVYAIQTPSDYAGGDLFGLALPLNAVRLSTAWFRFSSTCGNSAVDSGEECDPGPGGASSPTCDADCTNVMCADGFTNPAAGEMCDESGAAPQCDTTCQRPVCGDGRWNGPSEECDDGNFTDGDGCSSTCTLETCGNGTMDMFEICEDGNRINGDGCNAFCRPDDDLR
jgi:cysteine-rich repeat protein